MRLRSGSLGAAFAVALAVMPASGAARAACGVVAPELADQLFDHWARTLGTGNGQTLAGLYAADAVVVAPGVPGPLSSAVEIRRHASDMAARFAMAQAGERTLRIGCDAILDFGTYRLMPRQRGGEAMDVRFTRIYERRYGHWLITLDHASTEAIARGSQPYRSTSDARPAAQPPSDAWSSLGAAPVGRAPAVAGALIEAPRLAPRPVEAMLPPTEPATKPARKARPRWVDGQPQF